jgi:hypothetical protein
MLITIFLLIVDELGLVKAVSIEGKAGNKSITGMSRQSQWL